MRTIVKHVIIPIFIGVSIAIIVILAAVVWATFLIWAIQ